VAHRSLVAPHLYDDVIPCLDFLTKDLGVRVAVLTNGNANLTSCTALGKYLTLTLGNNEIKKYSTSFPLYLIHLMRMIQTSSSYSFFH
jgi:hypothetical protein